MCILGKGLNLFHKFDCGLGIKEYRSANFVCNLASLGKRIVINIEKVI